MTHTPKTIDVTLRPTEIEVLLEGLGHLTAKAKAHDKRSPPTTVLDRQARRLTSNAAETVAGKLAAAYAELEPPVGDEGASKSGG